MQHTENRPSSQSLHFDLADLEIRARLDNGAVTIEVVKSGARVHQLTIGDAVKPMHHAWIADLFAREDRIEIGALVREADDYITALDINQG